MILCCESVTKAHGFNAQMPWENTFTSPWLYISFIKQTSIFDSLQPANCSFYNAECRGINTFVSTVNSPTFCRACFLDFFFFLSSFIPKAALFPFLFLSYHIYMSFSSCSYIMSSPISFLLTLPVLFPEAIPWVRLGAMGSHQTAFLQGKAVIQLSHNHGMHTYLWYIPV